MYALSLGKKGQIFMRESQQKESFCLCSTLPTRTWHAGVHWMVCSPHRTLHISPRN
uniref:Uncharacterized protein n=1 Tax=Apteryx owenii TaxID=8824 RepID=A0A8B9P651_APTOW